jgi:hypothetical protein
VKTVVDFAYAGNLTVVIVRNRKLQRRTFHLRITNLNVGLTNQVCDDLPTLEMSTITRWACRLDLLPELAVCSKHLNFDPAQLRSSVAR